MILNFLDRTFYFQATFYFQIQTPLNLSLNTFWFVYQDQESTELFYLINLSLLIKIKKNSFSKIKAQAQPLTQKSSSPR